MHEWQNLSHMRWDCLYHVVIMPEYRRKVFYGRHRRQVGLILRELCRQRRIELVEGHATPDHVHLCLSIPPRYSVAHTIGFLKGKSVVRIHRELLHERRMSGVALLGRGLLREHGGPGRGPGAAVHPRAGGVGASARRVRLRVTTSAPRGPSRCGWPFEGLSRMTAPAGGNRTEPAPSGGPS